MLNLCGLIVLTFAWPHLMVAPGPLIPAHKAITSNCFACHELTKEEVSYGTLGPSLLGYGKNRKFDPAEAKAAFAKIYNPHVVFPCSQMPRFGHTKFLTEEQIKDAVALLFSPDSPVNK